MANKKTYYPTKTFDDDVERLANLFKAKGWTFSGVDNVQLLADAKDQRTERATHDKLESEYLSLHEGFGINQDARHARFSSALNAARGAFRNDKAVIAELDSVKRSVRKASTKKTEVAAKKTEPSK